MIYCHCLKFQTEQDALYAQNQISKFVSNITEGAGHVKPSTISNDYVFTFSTGDQLVKQSVIEEVQRVLRPKMRSFNK